MAVQLRLLGPRLSVDGRLVAVSWPRRALALLAFLFASRGAQPRDTVAFALWPDEDEETARANLRRNLNALPGSLPAEVAAWIVADPAYYLALPRHSSLTDPGVQASAPAAAFG